MPKQIDNAEMPADVSSVPFDVTITYTGTGTLEITYSESFTGKPASVALPPGGSRTFAMTITRVEKPPPVACRVTFKFGNNTAVKLPRVK